jgi:hypothetical protein
MATFPARREIMLQVIKSISPQVDHLYVCLNEFDAVPTELEGFDNVTAVIPDSDQKDLGKFYFSAKPDDTVFTIDDDIVFPQSYVFDTIGAVEQIGFMGNIFGYMANAWVFKKHLNKFGWRNYMFGKACKDTFAAAIRDWRPRHGRLFPWRRNIQESHGAKLRGGCKRENLG